MSSRRRSFTGTALESSPDASTPPPPPPAPPASDASTKDAAGDGLAACVAACSDSKIVACADGTVSDDGDRLAWADLRGDGRVVPGPHHVRKREQ